jgi:hypothetical protein
MHLILLRLTQKPQIVGRYEARIWDRSAIIQPRIAEEKRRFYVDWRFGNVHVAPVLRKEIRVHQPNGFQGLDKN